MLDQLRSIAIDNYDYPLPPDRIARYPLPDRDHSKLLCLHGDDLTESHFYNLIAHLPPHCRLVFNDTKVIHARLLFKKSTGAVIEIFCLEPLGLTISESFEQRNGCSWCCLIGNNKRWHDQSLQMAVALGGQTIHLSATRRQAIGNAWQIDFQWDGGYSFAEVIEAAGVIPLPPYMNRKADENDTLRYQTVYATHDGSVAAPTAGLHFTPALIAELQAAGISTDYVTLHVGAGTFKPVSTPTIGDHEMHTEHIVISRALIEDLLTHPQATIAVGTTSVRTLESLYWYGVQVALDPTQPMHIAQWAPYTLTPIDRTAALTAVLRSLDRQHSDTLVGETQLMIVPGYTYRIVDGLITNFHQPRSTLLLLVSALIGDRWRQCYRYALDHDFRFLSYGDSCLFLP